MIKPIDAKTRLEIDLVDASGGGRARAGSRTVEGTLIRQWHRC